jgi:hypothetical protein
MTFRHTPPADTAGIALLPSLVGAVLSVGAMRGGIFAALFLVPLGVMAFSYNGKSAWVSIAWAILGNLALSLGFSLLRGFGIRGYAGEILYFSLIMVLFGWIIAPPRKGPGFLRVRTAYRILAAAVLGTLALIPGLYALKDDGEFAALLRAQMESLASLSAASAGGEGTADSLLGELMPERILEALYGMIIRGGGTASWVLFFFISRRMALFFSGIIRHRRWEGDLSRFHVAPPFIWVLSFSLLGVLAGSWFTLPALEIGSWNVLTLCVILYLAQGGGIVLFFVNRLAVRPLGRLALNLFFITALFSPVISPFVLGGLTLLGIAENWAPFRARKSNGPSSTPGM